MIDIPTIMQTFVEIARDRTYTPPLSTNAESGLKSVLRERPDTVSKESYPYILVDLLSIDKESGEWIDDLTVNVSDQVVYSTNYELTISYHVYGMGARAISNQLQSFLRFESTRNKIETDTGGGVLVQTFNIESLPERLANKFIDSSILTLQFVITDSEADTASTIIDTTNIDGELVHQGFDSAADDPNSLEVDINV